MLRNMISRAGCVATVVLCLAASSFMTSCGGGGPSAKDMVLVEFLLVDRALQPVAPTGTESLPRNAQILMVFSELVNPASVNNSTIQVRYGAAFQSDVRIDFVVSVDIGICINIRIYIGVDIRI